VIYCHTCDLGFCTAHLDEHPDDVDREHDVEDNANFVPCCICTGIMRPLSEATR
jgi:hypothetical protein